MRAFHEQRRYKESPRVSSESQSEDVRHSVETAESLRQEISATLEALRRNAEDIQKTKDRLAELRAELGLPPTVAETERIKDMQESFKKLSVELQILLKKRRRFGEDREGDVVDVEILVQMPPFPGILEQTDVQMMKRYLEEKQRSDTERSRERRYLEEEDERMRSAPETVAHAYGKRRDYERQQDGERAVEMFRKLETHVRHVQDKLAHPLETDIDALRIAYSKDPEKNILNIVRMRELLGEIGYARNEVEMMKRDLISSLALPRIEYAKAYVACETLGVYYGEVRETIERTLRNFALQDAIKNYREAHRSEYQHEEEMRKARVIPNPEELSPRKISKERHMQERRNLAESILQVRRDGRTRATFLRERVIALKEAGERFGYPMEEYEEQVREMMARREREVEELAVGYEDVVNSSSEHSGVQAPERESLREALGESSPQRQEIVKELQKTLSSLVDVDVAMHSLTKTIERHYADVGERARNTIEQTMLRNSCFFVHAYTNMAGNANSQRRHSSQEGGTLQDRIAVSTKINLALEPSISASSYIPGLDRDGRRAEIPGLQGLILGGGDIEKASHGDLGTKMLGIYHREHVGQESFSTMEEVDVVAGRNGGSYNEYIVNHSKAFGYFYKLPKNTEGKFAYHDLKNLLEASQNALNYGLPFYLMDNDHRMFELVNIHADGTIDVGDELYPRDVARGRAGLYASVRKRIGEDLLRENPFKTDKLYKEASEALALLG